FKSKPDDYDIIITDMAMPVMDGSQLAEKILEIRPDIPIIVCTGYSEKLDTGKARKLNVRAFIDKPILKDDLIKKVRETLDQKNGDDHGKNI
ncbi:MAG: response regulator, partial [Desulfobacteraceae bacterium]|nr:response regulator [Desulfobacteraceae bacterium]